MRKALLAVSIGIAAQAAMAEEWVVEAPITDSASLKRAASRFQHLIVDHKRNVIRVATDQGGIDALRSAGLNVGVDTVATAKLQTFEARVASIRNRLASEGLTSVNGDGYATIPGYECFRTVEGTYATMDDLVAAHPDIAVIDEIGPTWQKTQNPNEGYEMRALRITNLATADSDPDRPRMAVYSSIHAREYAPGEVDTRFAEWLVNNYGTDPEATWLVDHNDFRLILLANPDARKDAEQQIYQRKNLNVVTAPCSSQDEFAQPGVDLNRNFPFHWNITHGEGSSGEFCDQTYRGPTKASEPESQNLVQYVAGTCADDGTCTGGLFADRRVGLMNPPSPEDDSGIAAPDDTTGFFVDIHSNAALVLWPWGDTSSPAPNRTALQTFGRRIAWFNGYTPEQSDQLYPTDGTTDDTMYGLLGVASYTIETNGFDFFEDCETFEDNTAPTNIAALRYIARNLHAPYQLPAGPDAIDVSVSTDLIAPGDPVTVTAHIDSSRFNQSNGAEQVRNIAGAGAYLDALPWDTDALTAMTAADGAFDSPVETANATISTDGLNAGRHFVYVQAGNTDGVDGTPNGAFFDVADASEIASVSGRVTDYLSGEPVVAAITLSSESSSESHQATSDGATGDYTARAFPGTFDLRVGAPRYMTQTVQGLDLVAGQTLTQDFALRPDCVIFSDDVENGSTAWTAQQPWVIVNGAGSDTTHVWNTPNYGDNLNRSLTTANAYNLTGYSDATLDFDDRCDTESGYDYGYLEYSTNGSTWTSAYSCNGQTSWQSHHIDLPPSVNGAATFKFRFRLQSDGGTNAAGWAVDNVRLAAGGDACVAQQTPDRIFADGFEP